MRSKSLVARGGRGSGSRIPGHFPPRRLQLDPPRPSRLSLGVDPGDFEATVDSDKCRASLIGATDGALARGVFGAPTMVIGREIFWGKDRMDFVERELTRS